MRVSPVKWSVQPNIFHTVGWMCVFRWLRVFSRHMRLYLGDVWIAIFIFVYGNYQILRLCLCVFNQLSNVKKSCCLNSSTDFCCGSFFSVHFCSSTSWPYGSVLQFFGFAQLLWWSLGMWQSQYQTGLKWSSFVLDCTPFHAWCHRTGAFVVTW